MKARCAAQDASAKTTPRPTISNTHSSADPFADYDAWAFFDEVQLELYWNSKMHYESCRKEFFDYVLLGEGAVDEVSKKTGFSKDILNSIRAEFEYWYPLDINLGGKEHMTVHFPVFLMNHVAVLRPQHWPRGILVNWYITATGGKISKSKGGAQPIPDAAERFGVDAMRLFYAHIASLYVDVAWDDEKDDGYRDRLERLWGQVQELVGAGTDQISDVDAWLPARMQTRLAGLHGFMDALSPVHSPPSRNAPAVAAGLRQ